MSDFFFEFANGAFLELSQWEPHWAEGFLEDLQTASELWQPFYEPASSLFSDISFSFDFETTTFHHVLDTNSQQDLELPVSFDEVALYGSDAIQISSNCIDTQEHPAVSSQAHSSHVPPQIAEIQSRGSIKP